tara:strand:+ start:1638 stop:1793 length:156 start_codon:yes stop_codon:yes gene_type:complete
MIYLISSVVILVMLLIYTILNIKRELEELEITKKNLSALKGWQQLTIKQRR